MSTKTAVEAEIAFLAPCARRPVLHATPSAEDYLPLEKHIVSISAIHGERADFRLGQDGVQIVPGRAVPGYRPAEVGRAAYLGALEETVAELTGASQVVALGNGVIRRSERSGRHGRDGTTVLGRFAHCDFSRAAAGSRAWVERLLPAAEAAGRLAGRYAIYNVWQCLTDPPQDAPLAFCDPATVAQADVVGCDQEIPTTDKSAARFELSVYHYNPRQRWFYFPDLRPGELLVFTGYDSDPARPQGIAHAAFTDARCPPGAPPRESIDERLIAFF
ncbi:MAG TPA: CmcJ/NvfI family oxidoreductase [Trebonia sp.]|jgi:hypothetical protein|nr:CmcJ/NvfI family oxidoreductase [Trebonia sp.]